jgi:tRNA 2-selenouridine synthase
MMHAPAPDESRQTLYKRLFLEQTPLIDLRAPIEFAQGAFPTSHNLGLMNDRERELVGTRYKEQGSDAAVKLGYQLVESDIKNRIDAWVDFKTRNPSAWLYCFRGGMRSQIAAKMLSERGVAIDIVPGGYKALRRFSIETIEQAAQRPIILVGGNTGSGKTKLIQLLQNGLDLEGRSNHKGSSFGKQVTPQPRQIAYENQIAIDLLEIEQQANSLVIEDESRSIGAISVPLPLFTAMTQAPMVVIDDPLELRYQRLLSEYCTEMYRDFVAALGEDAGQQGYSEFLHRGLFGIRKRLGTQMHQQMDAALDGAIKEQFASGRIDCHLNWIAPLLSHYYDPMYQYQLEKSRSRIEFRGTFDAVHHWLAGQTR